MLWLPNKATSFFCTAKIKSEFPLKEGTLSRFLEAKVGVD
jgi:hypothetical protein